LNKFLLNESVFLMLLLSCVGLWLVATAPSTLAGMVVAIGLGGTWMAILFTQLNRL